MGGGGGGVMWVTPPAALMWRTGAGEGRGVGGPTLAHVPLQAPSSARQRDDAGAGAALMWRVGGGGQGGGGSHLGARVPAGPVHAEQPARAEPALQDDACAVAWGVSGAGAGGTCDAGAGAGGRQVGLVHWGATGGAGAGVRMCRCADVQMGRPARGPGQHSASASRGLAPRQRWLAMRGTPTSSQNADEEARRYSDERGAEGRRRGPALRVLHHDGPHLGDLFVVLSSSGSPRRAAGVRALHQLNSAMRVRGAAVTAHTC